MKILIATQNLGKIKEIEEILTPLGYEVISLKDVGLGSLEIEENGNTFEENALIKAKTIYDLLGIPVLADDSGLTIHAIPDIMGIYTARYMSEEPQEKRNHNVIHILEDLDKKAHFTCALVYYNGTPHTFTGIVEGQISEEVSEQEGFGYDPIFIPKGHTETFADLGRDIKNTISHRGVALQKFEKFMKEQE